MEVTCGLSRGARRNCRFASCFAALRAGLRAAVLLGLSGALAPAQQLPDLPIDHRDPWRKDGFIVWTGNGQFAVWQNRLNWSTLSVPTGQDSVLFDATSAKPCRLSENAGVHTLVVDTSYGGTLDLRGYALTLYGHAHLLGASFSSSDGAIHFSGSELQFLRGPGKNPLMPALVQDGPGMLRLLHQAACLRFTQTKGILDLNGHNFVVEEDFTVTGEGLRRETLAGRTISVGDDALLRGLPGRPLYLNAGSEWTLSVSDGLRAEYVVLGHSRASQSPGVAENSINTGGNVNWTFPGAPVIREQPADQTVMAGETAVFRIAAEGDGNLAFQWLRNGELYEDAVDSVLSLPAPRLSDSGSLFTCLVANHAGMIVSEPARLSVTFPAPVATPPGGKFEQSQQVSLSSAVPGAALFYRRNAGPDEAYTGELVLTQTTGLAAFAVKNGDTSATGRWFFTREQNGPGILPKPVITPSDTFFYDSLELTLSSPTADTDLYYAIDDEGSFRFYNGPVMLRRSARIRAFVHKDGASSDTAGAHYTRRLQAPQASPAGQEFMDSLKITLVPPAAGAVIRYTRDGTDPGSGSRVYPGMLVLRRGAVLKAAAFLPGAEPSPVMEEIYPRIPRPPRADPPGGIFAGPVKVELSAPDSGVEVRYARNGPATDPAAGSLYESPLELDAETVLRAVAVAGDGILRRESAPLTETYRFAGAGPYSLSPGTSFHLRADCRVSLDSAAEAVQVQSLPPESLNLARGFAEVACPFRLLLNGNAKNSPVRFRHTGTGGGAFYALSGKGRARFLSSGSETALEENGVYFRARDTLAPELRLASESVNGSDQTALHFEIDDNVENLALDLRRSDAGDSAWQEKEWLVGEPLRLMVDAASGSSVSVSLNVRVFDGFSRSWFPADSVSAYLPMRVMRDFQAPSVWKVGADRNKSWDLVGLPLTADPPLTLADLRKENDAPTLRAMTWDSGRDEYVMVTGDDPLDPARAYWMSSAEPLEAPYFSRWRSASGMDSGGLRVRLRRGWNLVANPRENKLYWPVTRRDLDSYFYSSVKGLWPYSHAEGQYVHGDSLEPWRGYFAYSHVDTVITPLESPPALDPLVMAKSAVAGKDFAGARIGLEGAYQVLLGSLPLAHEGLGFEDEPLPPSAHDVRGGIRLWAMRQGERLGADMLPASASLLSWSIGTHAPAAGIDGAAAIAVRNVDLPGGWEAWAVSRVSGMAYRLQPGASIALAPGWDDTLEISAGPASELAALLGGLKPAPEEFSARLVASEPGPRLHLSLPETSRLSVILWSLDGRRLGSLGPAAWPRGRYRLPLSRLLPDRPAGGALLFTVEARASKSTWRKSGRFTVWR